jgi:hypothetical protein
VGASANVMLSVAVTLKDAGAEPASTSGVGPLSQNGHLGFGFSRPVDGPKLGMA